MWFPLPPPPLPKRLRLRRPSLFPQRRWHAPVHLFPRRRGHLVGELQVEGLQPLDLVAQPGRGFELQVRRRFAHLGLQVLQGGLEVVPDEGLGAFGDADVDVDRHPVAALEGAVQDVADVALDALGRDAVFAVVGLLAFAAAGRLGHGAGHGAGDRVGIEDHLAVDISGGATNRLNKTGL